MDNIVRTRPSWNEYYMQIAELTAKRASCFSKEKGAVIVVNNRIIATGYNGAPSGVRNCLYDRGVCRKKELGYGHGEGHHECLGVHAEANAILSAANIGIGIKGGTMYCTHSPCEECAKLIINSGIKNIYYRNYYGSKLSDELLKEANITVQELKSL